MTTADRATDLVPAPAAAPVLTEAELASIERQADLLAKSSIVPRTYRGKPADIIAAAFLGRDLGWSPMTSLRFVNVIDGVASISAEGMVALVRRAGHHITADVSDTSVTAHGRRADTGDEMSVTFTVDDAMTAGLIQRIEKGKPIARSKEGRRLPWELHPKSMMWARAVSQLCRMLFADVTFGVAYVPEEISPSEMSPEATERAMAAARPETLEVLVTDAQADELAAMFEEIDDDDTRKTLKLSFVAEWGNPHHVEADRFGEAVEWVRDRIEEHTEPFDIDYPEGEEPY